MQTINPISDPDEIRRAAQESTADVTAPVGQVAQSDSPAVAVAEPALQQPTMEIGKTPIDQTIVAATAPVVGATTLPPASESQPAPITHVPNRDVSDIYPTMQPNAQSVFAGAAANTPNDDQVFVYDKPFGAMLIAWLAGAFGLLQFYALFVAGFSISNWQQLVLLALSIVISIGLWKRITLAYWLTLALAAFLALFYGYKFITMLASFSSYGSSLLFTTDYGRLALAAFGFVALCVAVPAWVVWYLLKSSVARAFKANIFN